MAVEERAAWNVYARQLFPLRYGHPLWHPEGLAGSVEVEIGDVGYLDSGAFTRVFSAIKPADDLSQDNGVPDNFVPYQVNKHLQRSFQDVIISHLCSRSVRSQALGVQVTTSVTPVGGGMRFQCSQEQGAFVFTDVPADRTLLGSSRSLPAYIRHNVDRWHQFVSDVLDADILREDLLFISGVVKTHDWGLGAFMEDGRSGEIKFTVSGPFFQGQFGFSAEQMTTGNAQYRARPRHGYDEDVGSVFGVNVSPTLQIEAGDTTSIAGSSSEGHYGGRSVAVKKDQCLFLHFWKVKKRIWRFNKVYRAAAGPDERDYDSTGDGDGLGVLSDGDELEEDIVEQYPQMEKTYNALDILLDYILDYAMEDGTEIEVAVACDAHIYTLFDDEVPIDLKGALEKLKPPVMFLDDERQMACLACAEWSEDGDGEILSGLEANKETFQFDLPDDDELGGSKSDGKEKDVHSDTDAEVARSPPIIMQEHSRGVTCIACSPDGRYIASAAEDSNIILRNGADGSPVGVLTDHQQTVWALAFSHDGTHLASGANNGRVLIWDVDSQSVVAVLEGHEGVVQSIFYALDDSKIVTSTVDFTIRIWDARTSAQLAVIQEHRAAVMSAVFSPDGRWVASCGADFVGKIWDVRTGALRHTLDAHTGIVWAIAFSPDSRRVVTGSDDTTSRVWNAETGEELVILREHEGPVWSVAFSPDGKTVLTASSDATIKVCDSFSGELRHTFDRHDTFVNVAIFSPDGRFIASGAGNNSVLVWDAVTGKTLPQLDGHRDKVTGLKFMPDSRRLVSSSDDGTVRIWTLEDA